MIPFDRPIIGHDLDDMRVERGLSAADMQWLIGGISPTKWTNVVRKHAGEPVDPSTALLVRAMDAYPDIKIIPDMPTARDMFTVFAALSEAIDKRKLSIISGNEASAGYRWITLNQRQVPVQRRLFYMLEKILAQLPEERRASMLEQWMRVVDLEAQSRGIRDVFRTGSWKKGSTR